jgi:hypothetical protein
MSRLAVCLLLLGLVFDCEDGGGMFLRNVGTSAILHDALSQKTTLFTGTTVRISDFTNPFLFVAVLE